MLQSDLLYLAQAETLDVWLGSLDDRDLAAPSTLPGWTVRDLVAHLSVSMGAIAALEPVHVFDTDSATEPLAVIDYISRYRDDSDRIAAVATGLEGDPRAAFREANLRARQTLDELGGADLVVRSARGPILLSAYLDTRVIELVVHCLDLAASVTDRPPPPVLGSARQRVLAVLREALTARAEDPVAALAAASALPSAWLTAARLACGAPGAAAARAMRLRAIWAK